MNITHFDKFRVNSDSDIAKAIFMDVEKLGSNCSDGFMVVVNEIPSFKETFAKHRVEVRRKNRQIALISYKYVDVEIDDYWKDAEIIYSWEENKI